MGKGSFLVILAFKTANRTVNTDVIFQVLFYIIKLVHILIEMNTPITLILFHVKPKFYHFFALFFNWSFTTVFTQVDFMIML